MNTLPPSPLTGTIQTNEVTLRSAKAVLDCYLAGSCQLHLAAEGILISGFRPRGLLRHVLPVLIAVGAACAFDLWYSGSLRFSWVQGVAVAGIVSRMSASRTWNPNKPHRVGIPWAMIQSATVSNFGCLEIAISRMRNAGTADASLFRRTLGTLGSQLQTVAVQLDPNQDEAVDRLLKEIEHHRSRLAGLPPILT